VAAGGLAPTILTFCAIVGIGALLRATRVLRSADAKPLNAVIIYVGLPAFVFSAVHGAAFGLSTWRLVLVSWLVFGVTLALAFLAEKYLRLPSARAGGFLLASTLGNTGYLGYPLTAALLGAAAVPEAVFSDVFGTVFALVLVGLPIAAHFGNHAEKTPNPLRELLTFPAVLALGAALVLRPVALPEMVSHGLDLLASLVAPLIMLSVGLSLRPRSVVHGAVALTVLVALKLVAAPLLALAFGSTAMSGVPLRVAVLEASMPSMMLTFVVGERYGLDTDFIASAIFVTTVLAAITVPLVQVIGF